MSGARREREEREGRGREREEEKKKKKKRERSGARRPGVAFDAQPSFARARVHRARSYV
jgi:hypothetical protein